MCVEKSAVVTVYRLPSHYHTFRYRQSSGDGRLVRAFVHKPARMSQHREWRTPPYPFPRTTMQVRSRISHWVFVWCWLASWLAKMMRSKRHNKHRNCFTLMQKNTFTPQVYLRRMRMLLLLLLKRMCTPNRKRRSVLRRRMLLLLLQWMYK